MFDQLGNHFCWFYICRYPYIFDAIDYLLGKPLDVTMWFDGVFDLVQVRNKALDEVCGYLDQFSFVRGSPEHTLKAIFIDI